MGLFSKLLYSVTTEFSGKVGVFESVGVRRLVVGGLIQSVSLNYPGLKRKVWGKLIELPFGLVEKPRILVLGLGGGTVVHLVSRQFKPAQIAAVEIDPEIIAIAYRCFEVGQVKNLEVFCQDAFEFLNERKRDFYDLVLVDIYRGSAFPLVAGRQDFYQLIRDKLKAGGVVAINRIFTDGQPKALAKFKKLLAAVWPEVLEKKIETPSVNKNYIFYAREAGG